MLVQRYRVTAELHAHRCGTPSLGHVTLTRLWIGFERARSGLFGPSRVKRSKVLRAFSRPFVRVCVCVRVRGLSSRSGQLDFGQAPGLFSVLDCL